MTRVTNYRLLSLLGIVLGTIALFLGFFFVWVIAPVVAIAAFYLVFFFNEERGGVGQERECGHRDPHAAGPIDGERAEAGLVGNRVLVVAPEIRRVP